MSVVDEAGGLIHTAKQGGYLIQHIISGSKGSNIHLIENGRNRSEFSGLPSIDLTFGLHPSRDFIALLLTTSL
jgi:hypothetical protein